MNAEQTLNEVAGLAKDVNFDVIDLDSLERGVLLAKHVVLPLAVYSGFKCGHYDKDKMDSYMEMALSKDETVVNMCITMLKTYHVKKL